MRALQKRANIFGLADHIANNKLVQGYYLLHPLISESGAKPRLTFNDAVQGWTGLPFSFKKLEHRVPVLDPIYQHTLKPVIEKGISSFHKLEPSHQEYLRKGYGIASKGLDAASLLSMGSLFFPDKPDTRMPNMAHEYAKRLEKDPIGRVMGIPMYSGNKLDEIKSHVPEDAGLKIKETVNELKHPFSNRYSGALSGLDVPKVQWGKRASNKIRHAELVEIPYLFDKCLDYKKDFMINNETTYKMAADRILTQDTYICGDIIDLRGFINGGFRDIPEVKTASTPYYIRFVYVNPNNEGQGLAGDMIEQMLHKSGSNAAWIQISATNDRMLKVAHKLGFKKLYNFNQGGTLTEVLGRGI